MSELRVSSVQHAKATPRKNHRPHKARAARTEARLWAALQFRLLARLSAIEHAEMGDFQEAMLDRCFRLMEDGG